MNKEAEPLEEKRFFPVESETNRIDCNRTFHTSGSKYSTNLIIDFMERDSTTMNECSKGTSLQNIQESGKEKLKKSEYSVFHSFHFIPPMLAFHLH